MKTYDLANKVAEAFVDMMLDDGFETFDEMKKSYWWNSEDLAAEIDNVIECSTMDVDTFIDDDRHIWTTDDDNISINDFMRIVRKYIKLNMSEREEQ